MEVEEELDTKARSRKARRVVDVPCLRPAPLASPGTYLEAREVPKYKCEMQKYK
jgi:hypothetical protein